MVTERSFIELNVWRRIFAEHWNGKLYIGSRNNSSWLPKYAGELDDIRISGVALRPDQFLSRRSGPQGTIILLR
jgi:hypothetical protein